MSCEDGSWTIWMHFSSFVTYIFEFFDFRSTLSPLQASLHYDVVFVCNSNTVGLVVVGYLGIN